MESFRNFRRERERLFFIEEILSSNRLEALQSHRRKRTVPFAYRHPWKIQVRGDFLIALASSGGQNDAAPLHQSLRASWRAHGFNQHSFGIWTMH
jgi:hypothetical protein